MGKVLCFMYEGMADFETVLACHTLASIGQKEMVYFAQEKSPVKGSSKAVYLPDMAIDEAMTLEDIDALVIPGGRVRICSEKLIQLIQKLHTDKKMIGAICAAPEFLAKAGILENHKYTTTLEENYYIQAGIEDCFPRVNYVEQTVVRHENIITAKGRAFVDFAMEILDYFNIFENSTEKEECATAFKGL